jgi:hypothetical protein
LGQETEESIADSGIRSFPRAATRLQSAGPEEFRLETILQADAAIAVNGLSRPAWY